MAEHTPGPWTVVPPLKGERRWMVRTGTTGWVGPNEADARLIAAAPDLLTAAKRLVECYTNPSVADQHEDCWSVLENAIAKAEEPRQ